MPRAPLALSAYAALMGGAGVALAAASEHRAGGELGRTAAMFLILHAAALLGLGALTLLARARALIWAGLGMAAGATLFAADLTSRAFLDARLFPMAAPIGGSLMILSWLALAALLVLAAARGRPAHR